MADKFLRFRAFFRDLFSSSEEVPHSEIETVKEEKKPIQDFSMTASHFKGMTDPLAQLQHIKELMNEEQVTPDYINGLVHLYTGKQAIFDRMKQLLESHDVVALTNEQNVKKDTYREMNNEALFNKFPKSPLAKTVLTELIQEMSR